MSTRKPEEFGDAQSPKTASPAKFASDTGPRKFIRLGNAIVVPNDVLAVEIVKQFKLKSDSDDEPLQFEVRVYTLRTGVEQRLDWFRCGQFGAYEETLEMIEDIEKKLVGT